VADLGFDSLDAAELLAALHKETGLQLEVNSFADVKTVSDIARSLASIPGRPKASHEA
jgi:acyl carrier protein